MTPTAILTLFLFGAGFFTVICAILNYEWYFKTPENLPSFLISSIGRKAARGFFIIVGVICLVWGAYRIAFPPRDIPVAFLYELAKPGEIDLSGNDALKKLKSLKGIESIQSEGGKWTFFQTVLLKSDPHFIDARDSSVAGPDFSKGFHMRSRKVNGERVEGRIINFDADYVICDNFMFSKNPMSNTAFLMVICDEETSSADGLTLLFAAKGSSLYRVLNK